jgi:thioredoxin-like negative regulator of GroEL
MLKITNDIEEISKDKKAIVAFTATWCNPCTQMKPHFAKAAVLDKDTSYYLVDVDEVDPVWVSDLNIKSVPQIFELNNGNFNRSISGRTSDSILKELGFILEE